MALAVRGRERELRKRFVARSEDARDHVEDAEVVPELLRQRLALPHDLALRVAEPGVQRFALHLRGGFRVFQNLLVGLRRLVLKLVEAGVALRQRFKQMHELGFLEKRYGVGEDVHLLGERKRVHIDAEQLIAKLPGQVRHRFAERRDEVGLADQVADHRDELS